MILDLALLDDFQALVATGNFSRAAAARNMTQPAFSRRIRALEDWAGALLFDRDSQPIMPTSAGRALQPHLAEALRSLHVGRQEARAAGTRGSTALHFAATHVLSFTFFPSWLRGLESGQPLEAVQLVSDSLGACEALMERGEAQFLLCHHHPAAPVRLDPNRFRSILIGQDDLLPVVSPGCLPSDRSPIPYLAYSGESGLGRIVTAMLPPDLKPRLEPVFTAHLAAALRTMALTGRGLAVLPRSLVADDLASGRLVPGGPADFAIPMEIRLYRASADLGRAGEAFFAALTG